ncbi:hypothetical protein ABVF61_24090 [Roseibium sp. HPY-6]|uniref:hypothetical protein n=1 Tax=Roseibium sp. HPY-6 TaxID=3229852 RepID=UPI0033907153
MTVDQSARHDGILSDIRRELDVVAIQVIALLAIRPSQKGFTSSAIQRSVWAWQRED